jgi:hypothetical protein
MHDGELEVRRFELCCPERARFEQCNTQQSRHTRCASCCLRFAFCPLRCLAARAPKPGRKALLKGLRCRFHCPPSMSWSRSTRLRRQHLFRSPNHRRRPRPRHREPQSRVLLQRNPSRRLQSQSHRRLRRRSLVSSPPRPLRAAPTSAACETC